LKLKNLLDSIVYCGLDKNDYHYSLIQNSTELDPDDTAQINRFELVYTDALISLCLDLFKGHDIADYIKNDEISPKFSERDDSFVLKTIADLNFNELYTQIQQKFEIESPDYTLLKKRLREAISFGDKPTQTQLIASMNQYRWTRHFHFNRRIEVNIPSATLSYYELDSLKLQCEVVVGKPKTKTPCLGTWCKNIVLYPYWFVPRDIAMKELFPKAKKNIGAKALKEMQLIAQNGQVFELKDINWSQYNKRNFPYKFRQTTGCDNALGVIKFELTDPFDIYLHDTNFKNAFLSSRRYFSHGCVRVQKPLELGNLLSDNRIDSNFVKSCIKDQIPTSLKIGEPVPVFIVYMTAIPQNDSVKIFNDVYGNY